MKRKKCSWWHQWPLLPTFCIFNDDASAKKSLVPPRAVGNGGAGGPIAPSDFDASAKKILVPPRAVGNGGAGGTIAPSDFGRSKTKIVYFKRPWTNMCSLRFLDLPTALLPVILLMFSVFIRPVVGLQKGHGPLNITAVTGITVELKCKVKLHECGNFNG